MPSNDKRKAILIDASGLPPYDLGPGHPFARWRLEPLFDLIRSHDLVDDAELHTPEPASIELLETSHRQDYVAAMLRIEQALAATGERPRSLDAARYGLGVGDNPIAPLQHSGSAASVGGTIACVEAVLGHGSHDPDRGRSGTVRRAFNPRGGLHHAMPGQASGFCLYNDLVVAIRRALDLGVERVTYVDFDVHHGDGVERAFADDPRVQTISFHEDPRVRWPFTGRVEDRGHGAGVGTVINVPFASGTVDASWQGVVRSVLEASVERFAPGLLVTQHGCDTHVLDPLADLSLGTGSALFAAELSRDLADRVCQGRWVATGGGGYRPTTVLSRAWAIVWAVMAGRPVPDAVDPGWAARWRERAQAEGGLPDRFVDDAPHDPRGSSAASANSTALDLLGQVQGW